MKKIVIAVLLSAFAATPALAEKGSGIYVGVKVGQSDVYGSSEIGYGVYGGYNIDQSVTAKMVGNSKFMSQVSFAGEAEYTVLGSYSSGPVTAKASAMGAALAATYPINPQFSAIAKAGLARTAYDITCSGCFFWANTSSNTIGLRVGIAGQYNLHEKIVLRAGYDSYPNGYSQLSAGAVFNF